jgi:beta-glucanase (GH16 family)
MSARPGYFRFARWLFAALILAAIALTLYRSAAIQAKGGGRVSASSHAMPSHTVGPGRREPMPVGNLPGWQQVFTDDFTGEQLDPAKWRLYWGQPGGDRAGWYDPRHISVSDGMAVINAYRDPRDGGRWATGGMSSSPGLTQTYGKYLVRFRLDAGVGVSYAILLMPADNSWPPEIDISEDNGGDRRGTLATLHYGPNDNHRYAFLRAINLTQWHTLGVQWTPKKLQYTVDGRIWATMTGSAVPSVPMVLDLQTETWPCSGTWGGCPNKTTPRVVRMYVDWVVAYAPASR